MKAYLRNITMFASALLMAAILCAANGCSAAPPANANTQVVDGVAIYLGVMPAETIRDHPEEHPEASMHGGIPTGDRSAHVGVSLFDNTTGKRIENAQVSASVTEGGLAGERTKMERMKIADTISYGNYFDMPATDDYLIKLSILIPEGNRRVEAVFEHEHFRR